jgi:hypothetical protein
MARRGWVMSQFAGPVFFLRGRCRRCGAFPSAGGGSPRAWRERRRRSAPATRSQAALRLPLRTGDLRWRARGCAAFRAARGRGPVEHGKAPHPVIRMPANWDTTRGWRGRGVPVTLRERREGRQKAPDRTLSPGGGIGRRTSLRGWRGQPRAGSNPVLGTIFQAAPAAGRSPSATSRDVAFRFSAPGSVSGPAGARLRHRFAVTSYRHPRRPANAFSPPAAGIPWPPNPRFFPG